MAFGGAADPRRAVRGHGDRVHVRGPATAAIALIFLGAAYVLYTVTVDQQQADRRRPRSRLVLARHGVPHRRGTARDRETGARRRRVRPGRARQRHRLDDRVLGAAAAAVRGDAAAAGRAQRGRRGAAADRAGTARRGGAQHVGDRRPGRLRPVRHRRRARTARATRSARSRSTSRDALDEMRRMLGVLRQQDVTRPGPATPGADGAADPGRGRRGRMAGLRRRSPTRHRRTAPPMPHRRRRTGQAAASAAATAAAVRRRSRPPRVWPTSTGSSSAPAAPGCG